jgi:multidrug efflux system outer membrane protein
MRSRDAVLFSAVALALALTFACTLGPEPERPTTAADVADMYVNAPEGGTAPLPDISPWWRDFGDETTVELVELALANNTDLRAAASRVLEAEAALRRAGGARLPQVIYGASGRKQKISFVLPEIGRRDIESTTYSYSFDVAWQADLFGRLKRTQQSAWAGLLAEEAAREALTHSVVAGVVRARVLVATASRALEINRDITISWESTLRTVERRYRSGIADAVELYLARENYSSSRASEAVIEGALEQARLALDVLVGRRPGSAEPLPETLPTLPSLEPVPLGLPAELLDRRPDLRQAEMQLTAATYGVGAAIANLYPDLSLTGSVGESADRISDLDLENFIFNLVANITGPLFTGGQRRADVDAARARAERAAAVYAGAVLDALREVEEALVLDEASRGNYTFSSDRVEDARAADRLAKERYQRGVGSLLTVLETERRLRLAEQAFINATSDVWNSRIGLFLALGGDWGTDPIDETNAKDSVEAESQAEARMPASSIPNSEFQIPSSNEVS